MPKLINENTGQEVRRGTFTTPNGDLINVDSLTRWSDEELNQIGIRREPDPPPPPPPTPPTPRQRVEQDANGGIVSALIDLLVEERGITRDALLDDLASRLP